MIDLIGDYFMAVLSARNLMDVVPIGNGTTNYNNGEYIMDYDVTGNTLTSVHGFDTTTKYYWWGSITDFNTWTQADIQAYIDWAMSR